MRYLYLAVIIVLAGVTLLFALQNFGSVAVSFLSITLTMPVALLVAIVYVLGALTGGGLYGLLRTSYSRSRHQV